MGHPIVESTVEVVPKNNETSSPASCSPGISSTRQSGGGGSGTKKLTLAELKDHRLLERCEDKQLPAGSLIYAKEYGSVYWPACVTEHPPPDEDENKVEEEVDNRFAFLVYVEPQFRLGMVKWSNVIPVNILESAEQLDLILQLNRTERKNFKANQLNRWKEACHLAEELFDVELSERQLKIQERFNGLDEERKKRKSTATIANKQQKLVAIVAQPPSESPEPEEPKEPKPRSSSKFSLRPTIVVKKMWDYAEVTAEASKDPHENSDTSSSNSTTSSKKQNRLSRPKDMNGEALKLWTAEKFESMEKQLKFESKDTLVCSNLECRGELHDKDLFAFCHGYPFHKKCLKELHVKTGTEIVSKFKCEDCSNFRCFICKKDNEIEEALPPKCSKCELRFHRDCLIFKWPQADVIGSDGSITCPLHFCHICKAEHFHFDKVRQYLLPASKGIKCIHCLASYHKGTCIPAGTGNTIMQNQFLICPRHAMQPESLFPKKRKLGCFGCNKKVNSKDSTVSCSLCPLNFHATCVHGENHVKAGISLEEYRNTFKCEGCHWGTFPLYGQVVWYQQPGSVYWPSIILYPKDSAARGAIGTGQFSVQYCGSPIQYYDNGRSTYSLPLEIGSKDFLKKLNLYSNNKVPPAAKEAYHLIKLSEGNRDRALPLPNPIYRKIEKNLYRIPVSLANVSANGKRSSGKNKKADDEEICLCGKASGTEPVCTSGSGCFNRIAAIECSDINCSGKERCQNRMFSTKKSDQNESLLEYFISPGTKGWGLKTKCEFPEGSYLCEYVGEIISKEEKAWRVERKCDDDPLYFLEINTNTFIDAEYYGNVSRLINHSCDPNCQTEKYTSAHGKPVVGIFAKRDIEKGEELTFDYNFGANSTLAFKCRCKSENCKGFIGGTRGNEENLAPSGKKVRRDVDSDWKWEDECSECGCRGELLMCDFYGCPKAYHMPCLGLDSTPKGEWHCPQHEPGFQSKDAVDSSEHPKPPPTKKSKLSPRVP